MKLFPIIGIERWQIMAVCMMMFFVEHIQGMADTSPLRHPPCVVVFGRPGAGKSTIADAALDVFASDNTEIHCLGLDLDLCVPDWMRQNFSKGIYPTLKQREAFGLECCKYVEEQLLGEGNKVHGKQLCSIISFSFVNGDLRDVFRTRFPRAKWILVKTNEAEAKRRIDLREGHFYKNVDRKSEQEEKGDTGIIDEENSDWTFAPVPFEHHILDGTKPVKENARRVAMILKDTLLAES